MLKVNGKIAVEKWRYINIYMVGKDSTQFGQKDNLSYSMRNEDW